MINYIDLAFLVFAVIFIIVGTCNGLFVSIIGALRYVLGMPLSYFVSEGLYRDVYSNYVKEALSNSVSKKIEASSAEEIIQSINNIANSIPDLFKSNINAGSFKGMSAQQIGQSLTDSVLEPIALTVVKVVLFIVIFVLFSIFMGVLMTVFKRLQKKEHAPLKRTNRILGGVFGLVKAVLFTYAVSTIIGYILLIISADSPFAKQAQASQVIQFLNSNNPLL